MKLNFTMKKLVFLALPMLMFGQTFTDHTYTTTDEEFINPERGFSAYVSTALSTNYGLGLRQQGVSIAQMMYLFRTE